MRDYMKRIVPVLISATLILSLSTACKDHEVIGTDYGNADISGKTVLNLAGYGIDHSIRSAIATFNESSTLYYIHSVDYSEYDTDDDYSAGLKRLTTEIIAGNAPDIIDVRWLPYHQYVTRGLLENLYPFIDSDTELNRNDLMETVFSADEINGCLYRIFPGFTITTLVGNPAVVGTDTGWNMDEFMTVMNANPQADEPLGQDMTGSSFIQEAIKFGFDEYINWDTGAVNFNNDNFIRLLEFADTIPVEYRYDGVHFTELVASGRQILMFEYGVSRFLHYQIFNTIFGGDYVYKGFPATNRNGHSISVRNTYAITSTCADKDGAWSFLRTLLTKDWQSENTFDMPTNKTVFYERLEEAQNPEDPANYGEWVLDNNVMIDYYPLTQEDADKLIALIEQITHVENNDMALLNLILENATDYFNGLITAHDAARIIQNRISIYVSEQGG